MMYIEGSWCVAVAGAMAILISLDGKSVSHASYLEFPTTNNAFEYEALLLGLRRAKALGAKCVIVKSDPRLVVGHSTNHSP